MLSAAVWFAFLPVRRYSEIKVAGSRQYNNFVYFNLVNTASSMASFRIQITFSGLMLRERERDPNETWKTTPLKYPTYIDWSAANWQSLYIVNWYWKWEVRSWPQYTCADRHSHCLRDASVYICAACACVNFLVTQSHLSIQSYIYARMEKSLTIFAYLVLINVYQGSSIILARVPQ